MFDKRFVCVSVRWLDWPFKMGQVNNIMPLLRSQSVFYQATLSRHLTKYFQSRSDGAKSLQPFFVLLLALSGATIFSLILITYRKTLFVCGLNCRSLEVVYKTVIGMSLSSACRELSFVVHRQSKTTTSSGMMCCYHFRCFPPPCSCKVRLR